MAMRKSSVLLLLSMGLLVKATRHLRVPDPRSVQTLLLVGLVSLFPFHAVSAQENPRPSKVANIVEQMVAACEKAAAAGETDFSSLSNDVLHVSPEGSIELVFHAMEPITSGDEAELEVLGAVIVSRFEVSAPLAMPPVGMVQAWIPYEAVAAAAQLSWVMAITPPSYGEVNPHPTNPINSEGVALHNADQAQAQGVTGAGVTVGVISNGVASLAASQARSELPAVNVISVGAGDEGTAMLEIVHDMAPGAGLAFHANGAGALGHVTAINNLVAANVNVIAEDLAFDREPAFQQGVVAAAREAAAAAGIPVHSSAGNRGNDHAARVFAAGTGGGPDGVNFGAPPPGCTNIPDNVVAIAQGGDTTFDVVLGQAGSGSTSITLQWSEPRSIFPTVGRGGFTDLNLYVMDAALTQCLAESVGVQANGVGDTIETISIDMPGTAAKIVVDVQGTSSAVTAPLLDLRWRNMQAESDATTRAGSNDPDKNYTGLAHVIGAVSAGTGNLTGFSSAGPVNLLLTTTCPGLGLGPCAGVAGPAGQTFQGMDFLGASGVSVSGVGGFGSGTCPAVNPGDCSFSGTSASAPHTAGCDALVRELLGAGVPPATTRARLAATAIDPDGPGENSTTGAGRLDCFAALGPPNAICTDVTVPTDPGVCQAATVSIDNGSSDPFGQAVSVSQFPTAPYQLGSTLVELTVTDTDNLSDVCSATVEVLDQEDPSITAPGDIVAECTSPAGTPVDLGDPATNDNCDASLNITNDAPALFPLGNTVVTWTATDDGGNDATDTQSVTVQDTTPPVIQCNAPPTIVPPDAPVSLTATATDICSTPTVQVTGFDCFKFTKKGKRIDKTQSCVVSFSGSTVTIGDSGGVGTHITWTVAATDGSGNQSEVMCEVEVANPGQS